ncbi:hypothetical protein JXA85_04295 [Candidatus Woesearchaeota archaeon]|nr:hypothetical protein [Candidatus Woesearchaeota archaeon]
MKRRDFISTIAKSIPGFTAAANFVSCNHSDENVGLGNLYVFSNSSHLDRVDLETVVDGAVAEFSKVGLQFQEGIVVDRDNMPELKNHDVLVYIDDRLNLGGCVFDSHDPIRFREWYGLPVPYNDLQATAHCAYVSPVEIDENCFFGIGDKSLPKIKFLLIHEISHLLGGSHTWNKQDGQLITYYSNTGADVLADPQFYPHNVTQMKEFVRLTKNCSDEKRIELRQIGLRHHHYEKDINEPYVSPWK